MNIHPPNRVTLSTKRELRERRVVATFVVEMQTILFQHSNITQLIKEEKKFVSDSKMLDQCT